MGWTFFHRDPQVSVRDTIAKQFEGSDWEIIDSAVVNRTVFYAAARYVRDGYRPAGTVFALVCLVKFPTKDHYNFGYKDMSEDMGPVEAACPKRILDRLTPTDSEYANKWRAACRARLAKPRPQQGQTVKFMLPLSFNNGDVLDTFTYVKGSRFTHNGMTYRITNWQDRDYTINPIYRAGAASGEIL